MKRRIVSFLLTVCFGISYTNTAVFAEEEPEQPETAEETTAEGTGQTDASEQEIVIEEAEDDISDNQTEEILTDEEQEISAEEDEGTAEETVIPPEEDEVTEEAVSEETETEETEYSGEQRENSDYVYIIENDQVTIKHFKHHEGSSVAVVPSTLSGYPVTKIKSEAFLGPGITKVRIPSSVTWIESDAFCACYDLTKVYIPASVTITKSLVGSHGMFEWCTGLTSAGPSGSGANIEFGWTDTIPEFAFSNHSDLKTIILPDGMKEIGRFAFRDTSLSKVTLPDTLQKIGSQAFESCTSLTKVVIPGSVTTMSDCIFNDCPGLKTAGPIGSGSDIEFGWTKEIPDYAFNSNNSITKITIPDGITRIGFSVFSGCANLSKVIIPGSVQVTGRHDGGGISPVFENCPQLKTAGPIGSGADIEFGWTEIIPEYTFKNCKSLTKLTIPGTVKAVGDCAFDNCTGLTSAGPVGSGSDYEFGWTDAVPNWAFGGLSNLSEVQIPSTITSIGNQAFYGCKSLKSIAVPQKLTKIGTQAFYNCTGLTKFVIPESVKEMGWSAFEGCTALTSAGPAGSGSDIEFGWKDTIPDNAFSYMSHLTSIQIPSAVKSIGSSAFRECSGLKSIAIPQGVTKIGSQAFQYCTGLTRIDIPDGVKMIYGYTFANCSNLSEIHMSNKSTYISEGAFMGIVPIPTVYYRGTEAEWKKITIKTNNEPILNANVIFVKKPAPNPSVLPKEAVLKSIPEAVSS